MFVLAPTEEFGDIAMSIGKEIDNGRTDGLTEGLSARPFGVVFFFVL